MDPSNFDGTASRTIVHWLLAVEQLAWRTLSRTIPEWKRTLYPDCGISPHNGLNQHLFQTVKRFHHGRSLRQRFAPCISLQKASVAPGALFSARDKRSDLCKTMCRRCTRCRRFFSVGLTPKHIKVPTFLNGQRHGPSRQVFFRKCRRHERIN